MKFLKLISATAIVLAMATTASAELIGMDSPENVEPPKREWSALIGVSGGNSLIARDGAIFMNFRIGVQWNEIVANGAWSTMIVGNVLNPNVKHKEMINYKAFGAFAELFPFRFNQFKISIPIAIGGGVVNAMDYGDETFTPEEYFFTGEMALHFNYRVTKMLEVSIGGGYRMFAGIDKNNLDDMDFCSPFGELRFTFKEI